MKANTTYQQTTDKDIGALIEQNLGYNALHIGKFPEDWVTPGGMSSVNYRQTSPNMQTFSDVISKK